MKIGVKKVITNFWNREQVEPKPRSPPKTHFCRYKNTNDNLTKSRLMDFSRILKGLFSEKFDSSGGGILAHENKSDKFL